MDLGFANLKVVLRAAADNSVDVLVLPEALLPEYGATTSTPAKDWDKFKTRISEMCRETSTALTIGLPKYKNGKVFNSAISLSDQVETLARFPKIQLFEQDEKSREEANVGI